jgi:hypothetical protein
MLDRDVVAARAGVVGERWWEDGVVGELDRNPRLYAVGVIFTLSFWLAS